MKTMNKLEKAAAYADTHDLADLMEQGHWVENTQPDSDPMVSTSLRLPKSLLDWVRQQAADQGIKHHTALIRIWLEQKRGNVIDINHRLRRLEKAVFHDAA